MNLEDLKTQFGFREPDRGLDKENPDVIWRHGAIPNYTLANTSFLLGKTQNHKAGKLCFFVCFSNPTCPPWRPIGSVPCVPS